MNKFECRLLIKSQVRSEITSPALCTRYTSVGDTPLIVLRRKIQGKFKKKIIVKNLRKVDHES